MTKLKKVLGVFVVFSLIFIASNVLAKDDLVILRKSIDRFGKIIGSRSISAKTIYELAAIHALVAEVKTLNLTLDFITTDVTARARVLDALVVVARNATAAKNIVAGAALDAEATNAIAICAASDIVGDRVQTFMDEIEIYAAAVTDADSTNVKAAITRLSTAITKLVKDLEKWPR
ncbi:hypothetical protein AGMMS49593_10170 [Endomicrobiia bacterium]|nr:hypothetical protein AGMMS49593_10170 [Endomicrobiia bacterium]